MSNVLLLLLARVREHALHHHLLHAAVLESCRAVVDAKVGSGFVAEGVKTQVVAGLNFNFRGTLGDGRPASVKIFRPLPHTNLPPRVVGAVVEKVDGGVEKMMVESMFADE